MRLKSNAGGLGGAIVGFILCVACLLFPVGTVPAKIIGVGDKGPEATFLKSFAKSLDAVGIDVVPGKAVDYPLAQRPRLASLKGYAPKRHDWGSFTKEAWPPAFERGLAGVIIAFRKGVDPKNLARKKADCEASAMADIEPCQFVNDWLNAEAGKRVFVAFTRDDVDSALAIKKSLEKSGYVVFVFLKGKNEAPWADPALVGEVFAQADHRLVIDSASARGSEGVKFESLCCESYLLPPPTPTKWSEALAQGGRGK